MTYQKKYIVLFFFLFIQQAIFSQKTATIKLSEAISLAQENNLEVLQNKNQLLKQKLQLAQSQNESLPTVNATISEFFNFGRSIDPFTNTFLEKNINYNNIDLNASVVLYNGGALKKVVSQNQLLLKASEQDLEAIKQNIALQVVSAYLSILKAQDQLSVTKQQTNITDIQLDKTNKLIKAGAMPESEILNLQAQKATEQTDIVTAENNLQLAKLTFAQLLNRTENTDFEIERMEIILPQKIDNQLNTAKITADATAHQPEILAAEYRTQSAEKEIEIAKTNFLPTLTASANWGANQSNAQKNYKITGLEQNKIGYVDINNNQYIVNSQEPIIAENGTVGYFEQLKNTNNYGFGVQANIPIFSKFSNKNRLAQSKLQKENTILQAQQIKLQLRQNIEQACTNLMIAQKTYEGILTQQNTLEQAFTATQNRYNAGALDFGSYQFQKQNLEKSKLNLIQSKYEYIFRSKIVDFYQNKPLDF
ncbi:MAG: TolC family protein [Pseudarcicella sp.]|nr:TolC family protein [Pseudarcicella sp.]